MDRSTTKRSFLQLRGARTHNLKNVNLDLPLYRTIAITGPSGSGKSSLAYDTIFAEAQRQYVEGLAGRSRQFSRKLERPELDSIKGLPPTIAISQRPSEPGSRATVATITEIYDYLRLLFARCASARCYKCGRVVQRQTLEQIQTTIKSLPPNTRFMLLAPVVREAKGSHLDVISRLIKANYTKARVDGSILDLDSVPALDPNVSHSVEVIIDRLVLRDGIDSRLSESLRLALHEGKGFVYCMFEKERIQTPDGSTRSVWKDMLFSERFSCPKCDVSYSEFEPRSFSFNSPYGACPNCAGYGRVDAFSVEKLIADPSKSVSNGAFTFGKSLSKASLARVDELMEQFRRLNPQAYETPINAWDEKTRKFFFYGSERKEQNAPNLFSNPNIFDASINDVSEVDDLNDEDDRQLVNSDREILAKVANAKRSAKLKEEKLVQKGRSDENANATEENFCGLIEVLERILTEANDKEEKKNKREKSFLLSKRGTVVCEECGGERLRRESRFATICDKRIGEVTAMNVAEAEAWFKGLTFNELDRIIAEPIVERILARLETMKRLRLEYLTLNRSVDSLSGGELQRARLTTALGNGLSGVCYILDEPTTGLHPRDTERLIQILNELKERGNSIIVVEHNEQVARNVDWLVDVGPGAGVDGGEIVAEGTPEEIQRNEKSLTGRVLCGLDGVVVPTKRRRMIKSNAITLEGARTNNLKNVTVSIPLGLLVCVTGVSGSGKSSLIKKTLIPALKKKGKLANHFSVDSAAFDQQEASYTKILGANKIDKLIEVNQSPIGRPGSVPATYSGVFDEIRKLFAELRDSKTRGFKAGRFSFNIAGGRCEECRGQGVVKLESPFLPDAYAACPKCEGKRFNSQTLQVKFKGKSIADILSMSFDEAAEFFADFPSISRQLQSFQNLGLGYMALGQSAGTISGGEAQRIKLATELARAETGKTLYVLDEPTSGLHPSDVKELLKSLQRIVDEGNTVVVVEHSLDVMKVADWIIDLGPEGGKGGGYLLAEGAPEEIASLEDNETARFLRVALQRSQK